MTDNYASSNVEPSTKEWEDIDLSDLQDKEPKSIIWIEVFKGSLANYLKELSKALGTPVDYIGLNILVISSVIIGNKVQINVRRGWKGEPTHLWGALVGSPSAKKTVAVRFVQKALSPILETRTSEYKDQKSKYDTALKKYESGELKEQPQKPRLRQPIVNDATVEAIYRVINPENPECICIFRDELTGIMGSLSKYNNSDRSFFLEGYNSNSYNVNRVKYDEPIIIPRLSISLLGTIQPQKLQRILNEADDGFLSRFLFAFPEAEISEEPELDIDDEILKHIFKKIDQLPLSERNINLSPEAKTMFNQWYKEHEIETQKQVSELLQSSYGKMGGQAVRLACTLEHIVWALSEQEKPPEIISKDSMQKAIVLIEDYFKPMAKKVFTECTNCNHDNALLVFVKHLIDNKIQKFNVRTLKRKNAFPTFEESYREKNFLLNLMERGIIRLAKTERTGRPSKDYVVNPKLMEAKL